MSRRVFVRTLAAGASSAAAATWVACSGTGRGPLAPDASMPDALCLPFLTPIDAFFVQAGGKSTIQGWSLPELDAASHRLVVTGLVERELSLALADLEADPAQQVTVVKTLMCVLGYRACALWSGIPLMRVLELAGVQADRAVRVRFIGADGFENNLTWSDIAAPPDDAFEPLLALRMAGRALPIEHGYPIRLLLADRYGYKNVKWLARIEVTDRDLPTGQYQERGYPDAGLIDPPVPSVESHRISQAIPVGPCVLCGYALSGAAAIASVELAVDDSAFAEAQLVPMSSWLAQYPELADALQAEDTTRFGTAWRGVWVVWRFVFDARPGEHVVAIRARDAAGHVGDGTTLHLRAG